MDMSLQKRLGSGHRALLVGLGVLGCCLLADLIQADVSSAAYKPPAGVPTAGLNCAASDGKVSGRGSTLQSVLQSIFAAAYRDSFCGATTNSPEDEAGNTMIGYNYAASEAAGATGSGAGLKATSCRTDAFAGTDTPYTQEQLEQLNGAPGAETTPAECAIKFTPPFSPKAPFPSASDVAAPVMSFPVAGSAVAIAVNLTGGSPAICTKVPTALSFNAKEVSRIFGGDAATWADAELDATDPILKTDGCTGAITRVVRPDSSGTTSIFKQYVIRAENARTGQKCGVVSGKLEPWEAYLATNTLWPGKQNKAAEGTCTTIVTAEKSGNLEEIATVKANPGGIGYADLPQEVGNAGIITATVENEVGTSAQSPAAGKGANCNVGVVSLPDDNSTEGAVGLDTKDDWSTNNENNGGENHQNITDIGAKYPICGITFDLVYSGLGNGEVANAIAPLTPDQRRTLYGYFSYVETTAAQTLATQNDYAALPQPWVSTIREGFQENF